MLEIDISIDLSGLEELTKDIQAADSTAVRRVAQTVIIPAMQRSMSFTGTHAPEGQLGARSGRTRAQLKAKFFRGRDGLMNGAVKVIGDRNHIARFNNDGTRTHGRKGGPLAARKFFQAVGAAVHSVVEQALVTEFEKAMHAKGYR